MEPDAFCRSGIPPRPVPSKGGGPTLAPGPCDPKSSWSLPPYTLLLRTSLLHPPLAWSSPYVPSFSTVGQKLGEYVTAWSLGLPRKSKLCPTSATPNPTTPSRGDEMKGSDTGGSMPFGACHTAVACSTVAVLRSLGFSTPGLREPVPGLNSDILQT